MRLPGNNTPLDYGEKQRLGELSGSLFARGRRFPAASSRKLPCSFFFYFFVRSVQQSRTIAIGLLDRGKSEKCNEELLPRVATARARYLIAAVIRAGNYGSLTDERSPFAFISISNPDLM